MTICDTEIRGNIGIIWVDNPPVNALSHAVRCGIVEALDVLTGDDQIAAIVLACKGRTFIAGADISEFGKPPEDPILPEVLSALESSSKPVIAAIFGTALGGGLETAMACHWRIASEAARMGQPEVNLGLLPGAGGTQRLPRLAGVKKALELVVGGRPISASEALNCGIVDRLSDGELVADAVALASEIIGADDALKRVRDMPQPEADDQLFADFRASIARRTRGFTAPERAIQAVEASVAMDFDHGLAHERELFMECMGDPRSAALRHVFFAQRAAGKIPGLSRDLSPRPITQVGIIGAGTMGGGIAMNFLNAGIPVTIVEIAEEALERGVGMIAKNYDISMKRGKVTADQIEARMNLLAPTTDMDKLASADLIIEAVFENMDIKKEIFRKLGSIAKPGAILATNTSYLNIDEIAAETGRASDVLGLHFFSPANVMKLLEIVRARETSDDVLLTALALSKLIGKIGVVAGVCHGFIGNRMLEGYGREAGLLLLEGAAPEQIDRAIFEFGFPMGPFTMWDMAGLDIGYLMRQQFPADRFHPDAYRVANRLVEMDRKGQKTGAGVYRYEEGSRKPISEPEVVRICEEEAEKAGIKRRPISDDEIVERCVFPLVNTGANILAEGIAYRSGDIDTVYVNGYGFPRYRGGPMYFADQIGLGPVLAIMNKYAEQQGPRWWTPSPLIDELARTNKKFGDFEK